MGKDKIGLDFAQPKTGQELTEDGKAQIKNVVREEQGNLFKWFFIGLVIVSTVFLIVISFIIQDTHDCRIVQTPQPMVNVTCPEQECVCPQCPTCKDTDCLDKISEAQKEITKMRSLLETTGVK